MAKKQAKKAKAPRPPKTVERELSIVDAVSEAHGELETLGEELRGWYDNLPESIQGSRDDISEAADTLENLTEPDVPEALGKLTWKFSVLARKARSRSDRRDEAVGTLDALLSELEVLQEKATFGGVVVPVGEKPADFKEALDAFVTEVSDYKDEAEGVDFPGRNA